MSYKIRRLMIGAAAALHIVALGGCQSELHDFSQPPESAAKLAAMRSRIFPTADRRKTLRGAIAALQELGFVVDRADFAAGSVSGAKAEDYLLRLTVTVLPAGADRLLIRAVARYDVTPVLDADPYRKFFATLAAALALDGAPAD
jgi:hypothetical protein